MAKYSDEQCRGMAVNPFTKGLLVETYPHLKQILLDAGMTQTGETEDKILRYASLDNDPYSPMARAYPDPKERKEKAAEIVGYKKPDPVENPKANELHLRVIVLFLQRTVKSLEYRYILAKQHLYNECEECIYEPIKKGDDVKDTEIIAAYQKKAIVSKEMNAIMDELPKLITRFYGDDKELEGAADKVVVRTAETMADKKR